MTTTCEYSVIIHASPNRVWELLTTTALMQQWMAEPEMQLEVITDWSIGGPIVIKAFHHVAIENHGQVLQFDPPHRLQYSHLSSISGLPDKPEHHSIFDFQLEPADEGTKLTVTASGFPTEAIYRHIDFYWRVTVVVLQRFVEAHG